MRRVCFELGSALLHLSATARARDVDDLPDTVRRQIGELCKGDSCEPVVVEDPPARLSALVIRNGAAALARQMFAEAERTYDEIECAQPLLAGLVSRLRRSGYLLTADSASECAFPGYPLLKRGRRFDIYKSPDGRRLLKTAKRGEPRDLLALENEFAVLSELHRRCAGLSPEPFALHTDGRSMEVEFVEGRDLYAWIGVQGGALASRLVAVRQLCEAYQRLHSAGVLHGDVNESNAILGPMGAKLVDFEFGLIEGRSTRPIGGSYFFMHPEVAKCVRDRQGQFQYSLAHELYGLGALAFHVLTGSFVVDPTLHPTKDDYLHALVRAEFDIEGRFPPEMPQDIVRVLKTSIAEHRPVEAGVIARCIGSQMESA